MIDAKVVFKNKSGKTLSREGINVLPPDVFFRQWADGDIRRDIEVTLKDPDDVARKLHDFKSPEFDIVGNEVFDAWLRLNAGLSFPLLFLSYRRDDNPASVPEIHHAHEPVYMLPDAETIELGEGQKKHYTHFYYLTAQVGHEQEWYHRDPQEVVYDMIIELLRKWTMKENTTLLKLMSNSVTEKGDQTVFKDFTPAAFNRVLTQVVQWAIPAPSCIGTPEVLAGLDSDWSIFGEFENQFESPLIHSQGRLMDIEFFCTGSKHDAFHPFPKDEELPNFYMCGIPQQLGVRVVKVDAVMKQLEMHLLGKEQRGWLFYTYIATAITNSRAVSAVTFQS